MASKWKGGGAASFAWLSQLLAPTVTQAPGGQGRLPVYLVWKDVPSRAILGGWGNPPGPTKPWAAGLCWSKSSNSRLYRVGMGLGWGVAGCVYPVHIEGWPRSVSSLGLL